MCENGAIMDLEEFGQVIHGMNFRKSTWLLGLPELTCIIWIWEHRNMMSLQTVLAKHNNYKLMEAAPAQSTNTKILHVSGW